MRRRVRCSRSSGRCDRDPFHLAQDGRKYPLHVGGPETTNDRADDQRCAPARVKGIRPTNEGSRLDDVTPAPLLRLLLPAFLFVALRGAAWFVLCFRNARQ